jgi:hypothetical protein
MPMKTRHTIVTEMYAPAHVSPYAEGGPEVVIVFDYIEGRAGSFYKRNGDPGDPPEPDEIQFVYAMFPDGERVLTADDEDWAIDWLADHEDDARDIAWADRFAAEDAEEEARRDARIEDEMMEKKDA